MGSEVPSSNFKPYGQSSKSNSASVEKNGLHNAEREPSIMLSLGRQVVRFATLCEPVDLILRFQTVRHGTDVQTVLEDGNVFVDI